MRRHNLAGERIGIGTARHGVCISPDIGSDMALAWHGKALALAWLGLGMVGVARHMLSCVIAAAVFRPGAAVRGVNLLNAAGLARLGITGEAEQAQCGWARPVSL